MFDLKEALFPARGTRFHPNGTWLVRSFLPKTPLTLLLVFIFRNQSWQGSPQLVFTRHQFFSLFHEKLFFSRFYENSVRNTENVRHDPRRGGEQQMARRNPALSFFEFQTLPQGRIVRGACSGHQKFCWMHRGAHAEAVKEESPWPCLQRCSRSREH